jgi:hypothetical protein
MPTRTTTSWEGDEVDHRDSAAAVGVGVGRAS